MLYVLEKVSITADVITQASSYSKRAHQAALKLLEVHAREKYRIQALYELMKHEFYNLKEFYTKLKKDKQRKFDATIFLESLEAIDLE